MGSPAKMEETSWLYQRNGQVFGPIDTAAVVKLLYDGALTRTSEVALADERFFAIEHFAVFKPYIARAEELAASRRELLQQRQMEDRARRKKLALGITVAILIAAAGAFGITKFVRMQRSEAALLTKTAKEDRLRKELDRLLSTISIQPPLQPLIEKRSPTAEEPGKKRKRGKRAVLAANSAANQGELSHAEILNGVAQAFGDFKRCIVRQIQMESDSVPERIVLAFSVSNQGVVQEPTVKERGLRGSFLERCLVERLARVRFRSYRGEVRNIEYPITIAR